jgi:hypothetical protein
VSKTVDLGNLHHPPTTIAVDLNVVNVLVSGTHTTTDPTLFTCPNTPDG